MTNPNVDSSISTNPYPHAQTEQTRSRKVSIASGLHGQDNPGYESPSRKISACSDHTEIGPVRKKSILHKSTENRDFDFHSSSPKSESGKYANGETRSRKQSVISTHSNRTRFSGVDEDDDNKSWWYGFCLKCRSKDDGLPSWSPKLWPKMCPYPFCPTYRQFSRIVGLSLIGILLWCVTYSVIGDTAAPPDGRLFQLIVLCLCAHIGGWLMTLATLPALIGMLFTGMLLQNVGIVDIDEGFSAINKELRNIALVIILIRAGLDLDPNAFKRLWFTIIKLGLVPWTVEAGVVAVMSVYLLHLPWSYGALLGSVIAAVSPAVVVPCLFRLRVKGYGVAKGIPTLIIAVSGVDDAASVAIFGILKSIMFSSSSLTAVIIQGPLSVFGGIGFGVLWGVISNFIPEKNDPFVVPLRVLMLLVGGLVSVFGSELVGYGGAGPLACVSAAFCCLVVWTRQGWEVEDNPASVAFEIFWMVFEPILFGITGASIKFNELDGSVLSICVGTVVTGVILRMLATFLVGIGCKLNLKEKIFVSVAWMAKATVQAALAPVVLGIVADGTVEHSYGEKILTTCVLSIMLTAPTGAILITLLGPRLLTKTTTVTPEGWRRSHRPSMRDISITHEEIEEEQNSDLEKNIIGDGNIGSDEVVKT